MRMPLSDLYLPQYRPPLPLHVRLIVHRQRARLGPTQPIFQGHLNPLEPQARNLPLSCLWTSALEAILLKYLLNLLFWAEALW